MSQCRKRLLVQSIQTSRANGRGGGGGWWLRQTWKSGVTLQIPTFPTRTLGAPNPVNLK